MDLYLPTVFEYVQKFGMQTFMAVLSFAAVYILSSKSIRTVVDHRTSEIVGLKTVGILHSLTVAPMALYALFIEEAMATITFSMLFLNADSTRVRNHIFGSNPYAELIVPISIAFFLFEIMMFSKWKDGSTLMLVHHAGSVILWPLALVTGIGQWHLLLFLAYELSTPFLHARWFVSRFGSKMESLKGASDLFFALAFLLVRNLTIPALVYSIYCAIEYYHVHPLVPILSIASAVPIALNSIWGYQIVQMATKTRKPLETTGKSTAALKE